MPIRHTVAQGDTLAKIAARLGSIGWAKIYEHPDNAEPRERRPNPNVLCPGDVITIPDPERKEVSVGVDAAHRFRVTRPRHAVALQVTDEAGQALDGWLYTLTAGSQTFEGTVDGLIEHQVPLEVDHLRLEVRRSDDPTARRIAWDLKVGHLDPVDTLTGVQARLNNLGFCCGAVDDDAGPRTEASIRAFQASQGLEVDGQLGPALLAKLEELHGC
ncbi:MAG: peptidoglycan-binding protein [Myxococcales bacterium]|nr:peptidoglycan-binding protein [Myxococcales bacterium]